MTVPAVTEVSGSQVRRFLAIDDDPRWIAFAMTVPGRAVLFVAFGAVLAATAEPRVAVVAVAGAAACAFLKERRDYVLLLSMLAGLFLSPAWHWGTSLPGFLRERGSGLHVAQAQRVFTIAILGLSLLSLRYTRQHPSSFYARRPVVSLLGVMLSLTLFALALPRQAVAIVFLVLWLKTMAAYMWFLCYAVVDQRSRQRPSMPYALGTFRPFWAPFTTPLGKGAAYLSRMESRSREDLARTQLKAVKLLVWATVLFQLSHGLQAASTRLLGVPPLHEVLEAFVHGSAPTVAAGWIALVVGTARAALELAGWGHQIVACARLGGFRLPRNTFRPLESRTLVDFWNRYFFYFKELLVDFFFYPTFFRFFRKRPRVRVFFATFVAAGVGNALYHFVRDVDLLFTMGPRAALVGFESYVFYATILAIGIGLSQARLGTVASSRSRSVDGGALGRVWSFACVWGFVACLHIFGGIEARTYSLSDRLSFMAHELGVPDAVLGGPAARSASNVERNAK